MRFRLYVFDKFDEIITNLIVGWWPRNLLPNALAIVVARWTPMFMLGLIFLASAGFLLPPSAHTIALEGASISIFSAIVGRLCNEPVARKVARLRPFESDVFQPLLAHDAGDSFPSNHATGAFALAFGCMHVPGYHAVLLILAIFLSISRIYCGLHYVTDVLFGALNGTVIAFLFLWIAQIIL